jgi:hypothetical protein
MDFIETISAATDAISVKRVYGEPYERNGVVVIPAAAVHAGGGAAAEPKAGRRAVVADSGCVPGPLAPTCCGASR